MKFIASLGAGAAVWLSLSLNAASAQDLNVLCAVQVEWCQMMEAVFEEKTGLDVSMERRSTGEILDRVRAERDAPGHSGDRRKGLRAG